MIYSLFERAALEKLFYRNGDDFWIFYFDLLDDLQERPFLVSFSIFYKTISAAGKKT